MIESDSTQFTAAAAVFTAVIVDIRARLTIILRKKPTRYVSLKYVQVVCPRNVDMDCTAVRTSLKVFRFFRLVILGRNRRKCSRLTYA